jgi:hypothetical protein
VAPPVYSERFISAHDLSSYVVFQCPTGYTCIVTTFTGYIGAPGTSAQLTMSYQPVSGNAIVIATFIPAVTAQPYYGSWEGRFVFFPGEYIVVGTLGGVWDTTACGYQLTGEPPEIVVPT